jgi:nucleotide-binding universal stress UspA family protein
VPGDDLAAAILGYAEKNRVDHILIGARQNSLGGRCSAAYRRRSRRKRRAR